MLTSWHIVQVTRNSQILLTFTHTTARHLLWPDFENDHALSILKVSGFDVCHLDTTFNEHRPTTWSSFNRSLPIIFYLLGGSEGILHLFLAKICGKFLFQHLGFVVLGQI